MENKSALIIKECFLSPGTLEAPGSSAVVSPSAPNYFEVVLLSDSTPVVLRPIHAQDKPALVAFHSRLSADTRFMRYHYSKGELTESDLKELCEVDYLKAMALVAEVQRNGVKEIIGVARYIRLPFDHTAEVAFVVQDSEQNKGLGTQMLKHLAVLAWQRDIYFFFGEVLRQNGRMLSIFRKSDPGMKQEVDCACTCNVTLSVVEAMRRN
jgi:hypothetical protein